MSAARRLTSSRLRLYDQKFRIEKKTIRSCRFLNERFDVSVERQDILKFAA